jgi:hypothetical protein
VSRTADHDVAKRRCREASLLRDAELQFWLASAVRIATATDRQPFDLPLRWSHGQHVDSSGVPLSQANADRAAHFLQLSATFLLAAQIKNAVVAVVGDPKNSAVAEIRAAYQVARMTRNAVTHQPFEPVWSIDADCQGQTFVITNIISLNAAELEGQRFDWRHYGGPLAFLRLSQWVRFSLLRDSHEIVSQVPTVEYYQQGFQILEKINEE